MITGVGLDGHLMALPDQCRDGIRGEGDAAFIGPDFGRSTDQPLPNPRLSRPRRMLEALRRSDSERRPR